MAKLGRYHRIKEGTQRNERHFLVLWNSVNTMNRTACVPRMATWLPWLTFLGLFTGCLSRPSLNTQTLAFGQHSGAVHATAVLTERVVSIRSLRVAAPFEDRSLVYRVGDFSYSADPYAEFLVAPAESLRAPIRSWMRQSGLFRTVVEPGSALKPNTVAEITVVELYGDFREPHKPEAVLTIRFVLLDALNGIPEKLAFDREYSRRVLLQVPKPNALMAGWNKALEEILAQFGSDLRGPDFPVAPKR